MAKYGFDAHEEISKCFDETLEPKALMIDGRLAAVGGWIAPMVSPHALVWVTIADWATRYKIVLVKEARRQIAVAAKTHPQLFAPMLAADESALRFAAFLGFRTAFGYTYHGQIKVPVFLYSSPAHEAAA